jgi:hypothetical protein
LQLSDCHTALQTAAHPFAPDDSNLHEVIMELHCEFKLFRKIILAMCEHLQMEITFTDNGDVTHTFAGGSLPSPVSNLQGLNLGGHTASSAHSSVRSVHSAALSSVRSACSGSYLFLLCLNII